MKRKAASETPRNLICISDTHFGCRLALAPPTPVPLDDGGAYIASRLQRIVWARWREFWDDWVPEHTRGEPFDLVHNGDVIDGSHHKGTTQISHNMEDQLTMAETVLRPIVEQCKKGGGTYYHIRGTEAHVGPSAVYEEQLAKRLGAKPNEDGQFARYDLWKRVGGKGGPLVHFLHHIGTTGSAAHEASAVNAELTAEFVEAGRWGVEPPDYVVRSHRHRYISVDIDTARGNGASIVTPAWQLKTPFVWKIPGGRVSQPQLGGILIRHGDHDWYFKRQVWSMDRSKEE